MDVKVYPKQVLKPVPAPTQEEAEEAVRVLLSWAGDNPNREGLLETPKPLPASISDDVLAKKKPMLAPAE